LGMKYFFRSYRGLPIIVVIIIIIIFKDKSSWVPLISEL